MQRIWILLLVGVGCIMSESLSTSHENVQQLIREEHDLDGNQFCNYVYRRYYFVKRLHNTMLLFLDIEDRIKKNGYKNKQLDELFDFTEYNTFNDMRVQRSIDVMKQKRSLKPLFMIWDDFTGYKSIKDQIFVEEFTKEVFIISRNMLITLAAHDEFVVVPPVRMNASCEQLLNDIDTITEMLYAFHHQGTITRSYTNDRVVDLHTFAHIDDVMMRYYVIKRLKDACTQLGLHEYHVPILKQKYPMNWHHPRIVSCIHVTEQSASFEPLIELWDDVLQYKFVQDDLFMHEFAQLVLITYTDLLTYYNEQQPAPHKDALSAALELYQLIDKLPLNEILDVIDIITHDLPPLLEKYEFDSDLTWQMWLRKYWWAPPLIVATIAIHILMNWESKNILAHPESQPTLPPSLPHSVPTPSTQRPEKDITWFMENIFTP